MIKSQNSARHQFFWQLQQELLKFLGFARYEFSDKLFAGMIFESFSQKYMP
jgi:hypothetical protein